MASVALNTFFATSRSSRLEKLLSIIDPVITASRTKREMKVIARIASVLLRIFRGYSSACYV